MPISTPELEAIEYKAPDLSGIDVSKLPAPADVAGIDLSGVSAPKKPEEAPDYAGELDRLVNAFTIGHGPVKPEYVRDLVALHRATGIHPDLLHENKDQVPLAMKAAGRPGEIYTNEAERRAFIPEWQRAESELFADRTQKNDVAHSLDVLHIYGKYRRDAGGYLGLQGAWEAEAISQIDKYALPKELFVSPGELKRTLGADTPKFLGAIGMPEQTWKLFERGNLPLPVPASALMGDSAQGFIPKLRDIAYGKPEDIPAPKLTWERAAVSVGEGAKRIAKDKVTGLQAQIDVLNRHDETLEKGGTPGPGESPMLPWVRDSMMTPEQRKQTRADTHATLGRIADGIELDPEYLNSSGFVEDLLKQTPQVAEQVLLALSTAGLMKTAMRKLPGLVAAAGKVGMAVSGGAMFHQILGSKYQDLRANGIDEDRAFTAAFLDAAMQTPMEQIGLGKMLKGFAPAGGWAKKLSGIVEAAATEGVTEFSQQFVDDFTRVLGERGEDEAAVYLARYMKNLPQTAKDGLYAALIGSVLGGAAHTAGIGVSAVQQRRMDAKQFNDVLKSVESQLKDMAPSIYEEVRTKPGDFETKEPGKEGQPVPAPIEATQAEPTAPLEEDGRSKAPAGYQIPEGRTIDQETAYVMAAMSHVESGGRYSAVNPYTGASGRYQYLQGTWEAYSKDYTRTLFQEARVLSQTPENQEAVTQFKVREFLEKGYSPKQIAAIWNSGQPNWAGKVGVNAKYGNRYDVPKYVADVDRAYQAIAQGRPVPVGRRDVAREIGQAKGITSEQVDKVMSVMDAAAASWAETYGRTSDEWYGATFAGFEEVGSEGLAQYAGRRAKGYVKALSEGRTFEGKYDLMERFEISDQDMDLNIERAKVSPSGNEMLFTGALADMVKHDALYQNYPEIRNLRANILVTPNVKSGSGVFGGDSIHMRARNLEEAKDLLVHEIQHWVQQKEGFAKGSNPEYFEDQYKKLVGELKKWSEAIEKQLLTVTDRAKRRSLSIQRRDIESEIADIEGQGVQALATMDYLNTAGEIEARDAASRRRYGTKERAAIPPYSSEDISPKNAYLLYQGSERFNKALEIGKRITRELKAWGAKVDAFLAGKIGREEIIELGATPEVLQILGAKNLPLAMIQNNLAKISGHEYYQHGLTPETIKALPRLIAEPLAVLRSDTMIGAFKPGEKKRPKPIAFVVLTEAVDEVGNPVIVAVHLTKKYGRVYVNDVASAYGRVNYPWWLKTQGLKKNVLYIDKIKAAAVQRSGRLQLPREMYRGGEGKILTEKDIVKPIFLGTHEFEQERKGAVQFLQDGRAILSLFEKADVSTVIHELGHILRRQLSDADRMLIESWAGVEAGRWTREADEKFARAFERYVMEGKAPTWKLQSVFAKLKKWLTDVYRTVKTLDVEISDDVRRVFDRLLTTEAQRNADVLYQMDDDYSWVEPAAEPIPLDSITEYEQVQAEAARRAHKVVERLIEKNRARREKGLRKDAEATLNEEPLWQLIQYVRKKGGVNLESVRANFGSDMVLALNRKYPGLLSKTGKMRLDELASEYGYEGDDALTQAMLDFPGKAAYVENAMEQMRKAFGFEEEADLLDWQERYIEEEIKILGELLGPSTEAWRNVPRPGVKRYIDKEIVGKALTGKEDSEYRSLVAAMRMSQRNAAIAFREGRKEGALTEKLKQRELAQRLKAKVAAKREVRKIQNDFKKWLKDKGIDWEYRQQLAALVAPYDLMRKNPSSKIVSLREFVARQEAAGEAVDLPQALIERLSKKPIGTLTLDELRELHEAAEQIVHLGKLKKKLVDRNRVREFGAVKAKVIGTIMRRAPKIGDIPETPPTPSERRKGGKLSRFVEKLDRQHTQLLQPEFLIRAFDGFEDMGTCYQELFLPVKQAEDEKWRLLEGIAQKWEEIRAPLKKEMRRWARDRVEVPGLSRMLTREEHLMIALHARHEDNRAALVHGNKFTEAEINAVLASITPEEQTFLDRVVNELIPIPRDLLQDTYKNLHGRPLKMVQGDYVPMKFDREASDFIAEKRAEADAMNAFKQYFAGVFMEKGMTIERKGGKLPLHLGFSSIFEHLSDTVQFATHGLPVRNLLKLFSDRAFRDAVKVTHGENALDQLKPWLKEVASPGARPLLPLDGLMGTIRRNAVLYIMAYRMSTALQQPLALMQTMDELGVSRTLDAAGKFLFGKADTGQSWSEFVLGKSPAMRNRAQSFDRDLAAAMSGFDIDKSAWREGYERTAFALTAYMDGIAAQMTWLAAYQKAANGDAANVSVGDEAAAIDYADGVVNRTQGSGTAKNLAMVSRGTELHKVFVSFFYSFFSTYHNRLWEAYRKLRLPGYEYNALDAMKSFLLLVVIPGLLSEIASRGELPEKKEDLALSVGRYAASGLPLVRDAVSALTGYSYRGGLFGGMVNELGATAKAALSEKKKEKGWRIVKHSLKLGGYLTGLPPDQALIMLEAAMDPKNKRFTPDDLIWRERAERKKK